MKKTTDIESLIENKYRSESFSASDLLNEINSALNELEDYTRKIANPSDSIPENQESENISHRMGFKGPRNPVSDHEPFIGAKLAEAGLGGHKTVSVSVPDIFTMITNQNMELNADDRKDINRIVANILQQNQGANWIKRVTALDKFIKEQTSGAILQKDDFRSAISKLIFLSLMRKIGFMTAQPGKLFEYIIAPLIGRQARVVGSTDQEIIDIIRDNTKYPYSIKLFTGKSTKMEFKGSTEKLRNYFSGEQSTLKNLNVQKQQIKDAIVYIVAVASDEGNQRKIQFCEVSVYFEDIGNEGNVQKSLESSGYEHLTTSFESGAVMRKREFGNKFAIVVFGYEMERAKPVQAPKLTIPQVDFLGGKIQATDKALEKFKTLIDSINNLSQLKTFVEDYSDLKPDFESMLKKVNISSPGQFKNVRQDIKDGIINQIKSKINLQALETEIKNKQAQAQQQTQSTVSSQAVKTSTKDTQFSFSLKTVWRDADMSQIEINLGSEEVFNKWQMTIAKGVQETMVSVLNSFDSLSKNITKYFGTSIESQKKQLSGKSFAQDCVDNADDIVTGVTQIGASEGETITRKSSKP